MQTFRFLFGLFCTLIIAMIEVPPDHALTPFAEWFRIGGMPGVADWLNGSFAKTILPWVVWGLAVFAFVCFFGVPLWHIFKRLQAAWIKRVSRPKSTRAAIESYLSDVDAELGSAIRDMATYSAWAKWFASQFLANNNHQPARQYDIMNTASSLVLDALMNGEILTRGRPSGAMEYEDIPREAWRLAAIKMEPHPNTLWRAVLFPRGKVDPERIKKLLDYNSVIVNSREFEKLWPRVDKFTDTARKKLLKKARKAGADPEHIERLSQGHMATWP